MRIETPAAHQLLHGDGPPPAGSGLEPYNGDNDPWRWSSPFLNLKWVSLPVDVSWGAGATIPAFDPPAAGQWGLVVGFGSSPGEIVNGALPFAPAVTGAAYDESGSAMVYSPSSPATATAPGSGTAFLHWFFGSEISGWANDNTDVLPTDTRTIEDILGADFTVSAPHEWSEESIGVPGDFYLDILPYGTFDLYGPRTTASWPGPVARLSGALTSPDGTLYQIVVSNTGVLSTEAV